MDTTEIPWTGQAEAAILALRDIEGVSIQAQGDDIREIHVLTTSTRPAKQIVRDVQTLLLTRFNRTIDHRIVSVAFAEPHPDPIVAPTAAFEPRRDSTPSAEPVTVSDRIRFVSANLYVSGPRVQAQVELKWRNLPRMGSASGWSTRNGAHRLIVAATLAAVQEYIDDDMVLSPEGVEITRLGGREVAVVSVALLSHREQRTFVGCCTVEPDAQQAVVLATLAALNRVIGGLPSRESTASVSRPTST